MFYFLEMYLKQYKQIRQNTEQCKTHMDKFDF